MIRIAILFPNHPDQHFDLAYYRDKHLPLAKEKYTPFGLQGIELDTALSKEGKQAAPYISIAYLTFDSIKQFMQAYEAEGAALMEDINNFTDSRPIVQVSQSQKIQVTGKSHD